MKRITVGLSLSLLVFIFCPMALSAQDARETQEPQQEEPRPVYLVALHGGIDQAMMVHIRRSIDEAKESGAELVVFDIDTFGGRVDSALQITSLIGSLNVATTVAHVTSQPAGTGVSWSAGALISFSTNRIYMAPGTSMGAAAPVYQTQSGTEMAPEKVVSAVRAQMAALAEKNGYPKEIALAMVDADVELLEVTVDGEMRIVDAQQLESARTDAREAGRSFEVERTIIQRGKLLTLTAGEMERYGVSSGTLSRVEEIAAELGHEDAPVVSLEQSSADRLVAILTGAGFTSLLVILGLIALFIEVTSPGFGVPGTLAIVAFSILFISQSLLGTVGSLELLLFLAGIVLLLLEIFVIPGFGVAGISGILLIVVSLVLAMQDFIWPVFDWQWDILRDNVLLVLVSLAVSFVAVVVLARLIPSIAPFRRLMLTSSQTVEEGYFVQEPEQESRLVGKRGTTVTRLRPVGKAEIEGKVMVVEAEGELIEGGADVQVTVVNGNRVIVRTV